jgi:hypothetical protein
MSCEQQPDGWHLLGDCGEDVGPFATIEDAEKFLDWLNNRKGN